MFIRLLLFFIVLICHLTSFSQTYTMINGNVSTCSGDFYDSGGANGNYTNNQSRTFTICPSTPGAKIKVTFSSFALESNYDFLTVYDGNSTGAAAIGTYSGSTNPGVFTASAGNTSGCLTFRFTSDGSVVYAGWAATISCVLPCQSITSNFISSNPAPQADGIIRVCQGQSVTFNGSGTFSSSGTGASYQWSFGNGQTANGQNASYSFTSGGAYAVNLNITDGIGCNNANQLNKIVQVSTTPTITTSVNPTTICQGQTASLSANVTMTPYIQNCTPPISGTTFLPDGSGVSYSTAITVNCYSNTQTVQTASDIQSICLNMEHSFVGDLSIRIVCPNGQSATLKSFPSGSGTYLGCPLDDPLTGPGTGRNYCFTPTATTLLVNGSTSNCGNPSAPSIVAGNYMPVQPFSNLIGCPLNGSWTIQVTDNQAIDNGYIFNWDINFNPILTPASSSFTPTITSQGWQAASGLTSTGTTTASITPTSAGSNCFTYSITDNFGCSYTQNQCINVTNSATPTFTQLGPYCQGSVPGSLPTTSTNGMSGTWSPSVISTTTTGSTIYTFTPSSNSCAASSTMTVVVNAAPSVSVNSITICSGETNALVATPTQTGGTYAWSNGSNTANISVNPTSTTTYTVTYSSGGCTPSVASGTVTVNPAPTVTVNPITICSGETNTITATPSQAGGTYTWSTGATTNSISVNPTSSTTYSVTYSLGACTPATATASVTVNPAPTISVNPITICSGETNTLSATPDQIGGNFSWSNGATTSSITVNPTANVSYSVTYSLGACTTATATALVTVNPAPTVSINPITICSGETNTLIATPTELGGSYTWSGGQTTASISVNPTSNTSYSVTYSLGACTPSTANELVTVNPAPTVSVNSITICSGETNTIVATPTQTGGTYSWSSGETSSSISVNPTVSSSYSVTYSLGACTLATATASVTVNPAPTVTVNPITICSGETNTITATPSQAGGTYTWSTGANTNSISVNPTSSTTYSVTYSLGACTPATATATVTVNPAPTVSISTQTICSGNNGTLTALPSQLGGNFSWSNGSTAAAITVNPTNTTNYTVTYSLGACTLAIANGTLTVNPTPTLTVNSPTICSGNSANLIANGSPTGGLYLWSDDNESNTINVAPLNTTSYSVTYTLNGCIANMSTTVTVNPTPVVTIPSTTICNGQQATLTSTCTPSGGSYLWSNSQTTNSITASPSQTITYNLLYVLNGCNATGTATVIVNPIPTITATNATICAGQTATITASSDLPNGTYAWSSGATTSSAAVSPYATTTYNVIYTLNNCNSLPANSIVTVNPVPVVNVTSTSICEGQSATINASATIPGGTYLWSPNGNTTNSVTDSPVQTTNYSVIYTVNNCPSISTNGTITVIPLPEISFVSDVLSGCVPLQVKLTNTSPQAANSSNCVWSVGNGSSYQQCDTINIVYNSPGCFDISLTNTVLGCSNSMSVLDYICVEEAPQVSFFANPQEFTELSQTISFINNTQGATSYSWNFGDNSLSSEMSPNHYYSNTSDGQVVNLSASTNFGCVSQAEIMIPYRPGEIIYIPNTFTPDRDEHNQVFKTIFTQGFDPYNYKMEIFNRWGELIFESNNSEMGWDGSYGLEGLDVSQGIYIYKITFKSPAIDKRRTIMGQVNLIK